MERRVNDGCPVLKLVPCCPNTGGIQLCVTVWAAVGEQFLWMRTVNMQGKGLLTWPCALKGQAYTSVSTDSWFQPQWVESWQRNVSRLCLQCCGCYTSWHPSGSMLENKAGDDGGGFGCLERGRLHQTCGLLWLTLAGAGRRSTKWSISVLQSPKDTHIHPGRSNLLSETAACQDLHEMEHSG